MRDGAQVRVVQPVLGVAQVRVVQLVPVAAQVRVVQPERVAEPVPDVQQGPVAEPVPDVQPGRVAEPVPDVQQGPVAEPVPDVQQGPVAEPVRVGPALQAVARDVPAPLGPELEPAKVFRVQVSLAQVLPVRPPGAAERERLGARLAVQAVALLPRGEVRHPPD